MEEMRMRVRAAARVLAVVAASVAAHGQTTAPGASVPCADSTKSAAGCSAVQTQAPVKNTAQRFPFPGEEPSTADKTADAVPDAPTDASSRVKTPKAPLPAYPGEPDAAGAGTSKTPPAYPGDPDAAGASNSSSSSSSSDSSGEAPDGAGPLADAGSSGDTTKAAPSRRKKLPKLNPETPESREANDLNVAEFYQGVGNYNAAYLRAKDAVQFQPTDPNAHFALAEAARKLGKRDEAKEHYAEVLKLDPIPKQLKASQRALQELASVR